MEKTLGLVGSLEIFAAQFSAEESRIFYRILEVLRELYNYEKYRKDGPWTYLEILHYKHFLQYVLIYNMPLNGELVVQLDYGTHDNVQIHWQNKILLFIVNDDYLSAYDRIAKFVMDTVYVFWLYWRNLVMGWC